MQTRDGYLGRQWFDRTLDKTCWHTLCTVRCNIRHHIAFVYEIIMLVWGKKPTRCHLYVTPYFYFTSFSTCFGAKMYPSSGGNYCVVLSPRVGIIRMDLQEVGCGHVEWIGLAQDRDSWLTLMSAVKDLRVPWNVGNFLTRCKPVSCSGRTLHRGVRWDCAVAAGRLSEPDSRWCVHRGVRCVKK